MAELVEMILAQLIGNISTALIIVLCYFNFLLFENYLRLIVWAFLVSQALRQAKTNIVSILEYLSDDPDVNRYGFLNSIFSKCADIFITHAHDGSRRTPKELFLNYGTFLFLLIGAVSIWMRMFTWVSFLHAFIGFWIVALSLIKILDRRIFYYRYFISDEVLVSVLLMLGFFIAIAMVVLYLGTESYLEGSRAASDVSEWIQHNFINDERTRQLWSEQIANSRAMISEAISGVEDNYNDTMWWPPLKSLVKTYYFDTKADGGNATVHASLFSKLRLPENMTFVQAITFAYSKVDSVNLTSVQLTDWTSKGLEFSSLALGSVAQLVFFVFTFLIAFISLGVRAVFFISTLFYLLCTKWDPIERFVEDLLPIQVSKRPDVVQSLRKVVEGVFFLPLKMSSIHAMVTMVSFTIVNADYMYLATTVTFFISIVPIIPPYLVCVPWVISIGISSSVVKAIVLFVTQYVAFTVLDDMLYEKSIVAVNSYVSALSVVFGVYVFGFEGVIFGPLIVCGVSFAYDASNHGIQAAQDDHGRASDDAATDMVDESDEDGSQSPGSSTEDDDPTKTGESAERDGQELGGLNTNIFSNAMYRVISAPLVDRVRRRLSIDIAMEDSVCVTLVIEGLKVERKVRFVVNKAWSLKAMYENIRRMLHAQAIEGIYDADGAELLSPLHILPNETLHVRARPKLRSQTYPDGSTHTDSHLRVLIPPFSSTGSRRRSQINMNAAVSSSKEEIPSANSVRIDTSTISPSFGSGRKMGAMTPIHGSTASQRLAHDRIKRLHTAAPGRRHSLGAGRSSDVPLIDSETAPGAATQSKGKRTPVAQVSRSRSSSSTQENDSVSDGETFFTPTKERIQALQKEIADPKIGSSLVASPASSKSSRRSRDSLDVPSPDYVGATVAGNATIVGPDRDGDDDQEMDAKDPAAPKQPALGKRTRALRMTGGAKLMFSPLAVETKRALAYDEEDEKDDEKPSERAAAEEAKTAKELK